VSARAEDYFQDKFSSFIMKNFWDFGTPLPSGLKTPCALLHEVKTSRTFGAEEHHARPLLHEVKTACKVSFCYEEVPGFRGFLVQT
jgi:hypothetical protein